MFTPRILDPLDMPLLEGPVGVEDLVLLEPLDEDSLIKNLQLRYENKEIYVSSAWVPGSGVPRGFWYSSHQAHLLQPPLPPTPDLHWECGDLGESLPAASHLWPRVHCQIPGLHFL